MSLVDYPERWDTQAAGLPTVIDALTFGAVAREGFHDPTSILDVAAQLDYRIVPGRARRSNGTTGHAPLAIATAACASGGPLGWTVAFDGRVCKVAVGRAGPQLHATVGALDGSLGGPASRAPVFQPAWSGWSFVGLFGHPVSAPEPILDQLLDGLSGHDLVIQLYGSPYPPQRLQARLQALRSGAERVDREHLKQSQQSDVNRTALRARALLDAAAQRLETGETHGLWRCSLLVGSSDPDAATAAASILAGMLDGGSPDAQPVRAHPCGGSDGWSPHANLWTHAEVASCLLLPTRDRAGFAVVREPDFQVEHDHGGSGLELGHLLDREQDTGRMLEVTPRSLCRHALVAGQTGSGKSTTVRSLLDRLAGRSIPFLVLDPVKPVDQEYADLGRRVSDLVVFAAGKADEPGRIPFRFNPMAFPRGFPLFTHIDFLKATFAAAFGLFPPTPYLLESAIYRTYEKRGWDLATGRHARGHDRMAMPTLSDLLAEITPVVEAAGYGDEIRQNLEGALKTRVGNLCLGPKGLALDTRDELPDALLFDHPTVIGLMHLGSTQEQAFLMGLLVTRLVEVRQVRGLPPDDDLRHLLVVEEAHRLLKKAAKRSSEEANMDAQAVETFVNLIAEIRAYGQGLVVVEQIPSNLATNVVKQTSLKVVHRMTPAEDRRLLGEAMVMDKEQQRALATLPTGRAVVYGETMEGPLSLQIDRLPPPPPGSAPDWGRRASRALTASDRRRLLASVVRGEHRSLLDRPELRDDADSVLARCLDAPPGKDELAPLRSSVRRALEARGESPDRARLDRAATLLLEAAWTRRALFFGLTEAQWERARARLDKSPDAFLASWRSMRHRFAGPHSWCQGCPAACRYGYEGQLLGRTVAMGAAVDDVLGGAPDIPVRLETGVDRALDERMPRVTRSGAGLTFCAVGHAAVRAGLSRSNVDWLLGELP
jgi:DNA helicase HerA-like ATPase